MARTFASAMMLFAHPDDCDFGCGGTVAAWTDAGTEVHYVVITDGSAGDNAEGAVRAEVAEVRQREQRAAADILGVSSVSFLGETDGHLEVTADARRKVCREVRRLRPEVLVCPDPSRLWFGEGYVNHWDHKQAGVLGLAAVMPDAPSRPMFPELLAEGFEPYEIPNLYLAATADPDTYVDITRTMDRKLAALAAHASQGTERSTPWVRQRAEEAAAQAANGALYAEAFKAFRFVDDDEVEGDG
ncbi:MAG TPA: PIG-L deacetylase family protein [Actinomycetota bacterium]|nr:PIG-L deacetylase family protein [Actinomycetota bacterium]